MLSRLFYTQWFQSSIAPKSDRNPLGGLVVGCVVVPILDRPEERPQSGVPGVSGLWSFWFQSSIAPKSDRNLCAVRSRFENRLFQSSIAPKSDRNSIAHVALSDRLKFQSSIAPKSDRNRSGAIKTVDRKGSNPRSPRRATAISTDLFCRR